MSKQKIAIFDIDGTIFRSGLYQELLFELIRQNKIPKEIEKIFAKQLKDWKKRTNDEAFDVFNNKSVEAFQEALKHVSKQDYQAVIDQVITKKADFCYSYTTDLIKRLKKKGYYLITISGSQHELVEKFAKFHGLDLAIGETYKLDNEGEFTGKVERKTYLDKHLILKQALDWDKFTLKDSYGIGDTSGDEKLLELVDNPIAFNPLKKLLKTAKANHWPIVIERKNVIYKLTPTEKGYLLDA